MPGTSNSQQFIRSDAELAQMVARVAQTTQPDVIICVTESGAFVQHLLDQAQQFRIVAASAKAETCEAMRKAGIEAVRLPLQAAEKYNQVRHVLSVALRTGAISVGDFVVCALGASVYPEEGDLIVLTDVDPELEHLPVSDLVKLTDGIQPSVLEIGVAIASKIGRAARRSKQVGAIFMIGDSLEVLEGSHQLIPNPFKGHEDDLRRLTNPAIHDTLIELAKLDGAFVIRGDGYIQSAAVFLATGEGEIQIPTGLGARHAAAAAVTARSRATAIVVSATDGNVRVFSDGKMVMKLDPDVPHGPIALEQ
ncbi:MAG: diadenylate cyclase [Chloroflexota bacterium]|jgi:DNA integrity scanning protein DisA with diadenylate cyclase activity